MTENTELLRYPIGKFKYSGPVDVQNEIKRISTLPSLLKIAVSGLNDAQLDTPYREGGWTLRQVVHHLPDSHMNAYIRFKLALTEVDPVIRPYDEALWAESHEAKTSAINSSLDLLDALHRRWVDCLRTMKDEDWIRTYHHPEHKRNFQLREILCMYAWHGEHHLGHVTQTRNNLVW